MGIGFSVRIAVECGLDEAIENNDDACLNYDVLSPDEVMRRSADHSILLLDVRTPREYVCHRVENAKLLPVQELAARFTELDFARPTICICEHGIRSETAAAFLAAKGFTDIATMRGGLVQWPGSLVRGPFTSELRPCEEK